jgi:hypothetical protein
MVEVAQDLASWIRKALADRFNDASQEQQDRAEDRARSAQDQVSMASTDEERIKAQATADAWREIAEQLSRDNEQLKQKLEETIRLSQVYARKRIDSEAEQKKVKGSVQSLKPPEDG